MKINFREKILQQQLHSQKVDAIFISFLPHLRYISNFSGSNGIGIIFQNELPIFVTDGRYKEQIKLEIKNWKTIIAERGKNLISALSKNKEIHKCKKIAFDKNTISYSSYLLLKNTFPKIAFVSAEFILEKLISKKDSYEISQIEKAIEITDATFSKIINEIKIGKTENQIAARISYLQKFLGGSCDAFETIVASGKNAVLPHARPTQKKIREKEILILDFGTVVNGYHSDMTRSVAIGKISHKLKKIYQIVLDAQQKAIENVKSGIAASKLDAIARNYISKNGYGKFFNHSLGHGVGLQIHEFPILNSQNKFLLEEGNIITIEPGIYFPNLGGVRIEDIVVVEKDGCRVLTKSEKKLFSL